MRNQDTDFFWEGTKQGELRLQTCNACGELRHPPGPVCPACHAMDRGYVVATGRGTVFCFLVHHAPQMPGTRAAVDDRARRARGRGAVSWPTSAATRRTSRSATPVVVGWDEVDDELTLPIWEVAR